MYRPILFAGIPGAHSVGQLKLFNFFQKNVWDGRFKSQTLLDERAVFARMACVDLNPIRAKMKTTLETSKHTSIKQRIHCLIKGGQPRKLIRFVGNHRELVDSTGRCITQNENSMAILTYESVHTRLLKSL